jgi:WD40 repeat protein
MSQGFDLLYVAFAPDNRRLLTCGFDFCARLWDARTGQPLSGLLRHGQPVFWGAFSPDGRSVVTLSRDKTARVWDAATGQPLIPPLQHKAKLVQAAWSADGKWLRTLTEDDCLQVWDLATGEPLTPPRKVREPGDGIASLSIAAPAVADEALVRDDRPVADLVQLSQMLAVGRIDQGGNLVPIELQDLTRDWELLRDRLPGQFSAKTSEIVAWHCQEARVSEAETNLTAAVFHLDQALEHQPRDRALAQERARLRSVMTKGSQ